MKSDERQLPKRTMAERVKVSLNDEASIVKVLPESDCDCVSIWDECTHYDGLEDDYRFSVAEFPGCCGVAVLHDLDELAGMKMEDVQDEAIRQILAGIGTSSMIATDIVRIRGARRDNHNNDYLLRNGFTEVSRFVNSSTGNTIGVFMWVKPKRKPKRTRR